MIVDVLVESDVHPWQRTVLELLRKKYDTRVHEVLCSSRHRRAPVIALYAYLDRWVSPRRDTQADEGSVDALLESAGVVIDLTEGGISFGRRTTATVLLPRPSRLDEAALLDTLVTGETTLGLEIVSGAGEPIASSTIALVRLSARRSSIRAGHRLAALIDRTLAGDVGGEVVEQSTARPASRASSAAVARLLAAAAAAAGRVATTRRSWRVEVGTTNDDEPFTLPAMWRTVDAPAGRWYADPFLVRDASGTYLFVEDFDVRLGRASLAAIDLATGQATTVVSADHHLSYPFVFDVDGAWYMLPETAGGREVVLYRCNVFPYEWTRDTVLLDSLIAYDSTLLKHDGLWWLFFASGTPGAADDDELHLWFSEELRGPYRPHPLNPIRSTVIGSRPAGRIVEDNGRLLRPGQDGSREYGGAIVIQQIDCLSTTEYSEHTIARIDASDVRARGIHTINRLVDTVVVDTKHAAAKMSRR